MNIARIKELLHENDLRTLFIEELGWDNLRATLGVDVDGRHVTAEGIAEKRDLVVLAVDYDDALFPTEQLKRQQVERAIAKVHLEHLLVFRNRTSGLQIWQWSRRAASGPARYREWALYPGQSGEVLAQRLAELAFTLDQEDALALVDVTAATGAAFDVDRVTRAFYDRFREEHEVFAQFVDGIGDVADRAWYASLMLNRLMFVYFVQRKGFLDGDVDYLRNRLDVLQKSQGSGHFLSFYRFFLTRLFHEGLGTPFADRASDLEQLLGEVPYLNGGLFDVHDLELRYPGIDIPDDAFGRIFDFFDRYQWHLDDRPLRSDNEINPDVLGYIFEKYINQQEMGAYYTGEDVTRYIASSTFFPWLLEECVRRSLVTWERIALQLASDPDRYIFSELRDAAQTALLAEVAQGLDDASHRAGWRAVAVGSGTLADDTWRDIIYRRERYYATADRLREGVADGHELLTLNIDLPQLAQDVLSSFDDLATIVDFYELLREARILDPTCGSGAFLFAALNLLEPLYTGVLERIEDLVADVMPTDAPADSSARVILHDANAHASRRYFVLKTAVLRNLFGVDLMDEAVEICKLRLFLKLMAQVDSPSQIEPLPDIDFNVRSGNTLVGFGSLADALAVARSQLDFGDQLRDLERRAEEADDAFAKFISAQDSLVSQPQAEAKRALRERLGALRADLDRYAARRHSIDPDDVAAFGTWVEQARPFHWFIEFHEVMARGGFPVIIGNPPYVETEKVHTYSTVDYDTEPTGNLYALVVERCTNLRCAEGRIGMIVPVSSISTDGYFPLQRILRRGDLTFSAFDDRPSKLFQGLEHSRLVILLVEPETSRPRYASTRYNKWTRNQRETLFVTLSFQETRPRFIERTLPKLSDAREVAILARLGGERRVLREFALRAGSHDVHYSRKVGYFLQVLDFVPRVLDAKGNVRPPSEFKTLRFSTEAEAASALCLLNSSLFYWFVTVFSDCRHLNRREIDSFPIDLERLAAEQGQELVGIGHDLMERLRETSEERRVGSLMVEHIYPRHAKDLIDAVDAALGHHYGFTADQVDFISSYDEAFRIGRI